MYVHIKATFYDCRSQGHCRSPKLGPRTAIFIPDVFVVSRLFGQVLVSRMCSPLIDSPSADVHGGQQSDATGEVVTRRLESNVRVDVRIGRSTVSCCVCPRKKRNANRCMQKPPQRCCQVTSCNISFFFSLPSRQIEVISPSLSCFGKLFSPP